MSDRAEEPARRQAGFLVVCTANVCRSPLAERVFQRSLGERSVPARVTSAGTHGGRNVVHPDTLRAAREIEVDLTEHQSRLLTPELIAADGPDLVITMTREHLRAVVGLDPDAWPRSFTLKELARRAFDVPASVTDLSAWVAAASEGRRAADLMSPSTTDDLIDPYGGPYRGHVDMVRDVQELVGRLARLMPST